MKAKRICITMIALLLPTIAGEYVFGSFVFYWGMAATALGGLIAYRFA